MNSPSKQFITELTADGSPTLRIKTENSANFSSENRPESMHHSAGAATETKYIYGEAARLLKKTVVHPQICVVGLGLGYIELLMAEIFSEFIIWSYEADDELSQSFLNWLEQKKSHLFIYDEVVKSLALDKEYILGQMKKNSLVIKGALNLSTLTEGVQQFNLICFDAFSSKTTSALWTEEFLDFFIQKMCHKSCVFVTYACTGVLKRALKKNGFTLLPKKGFTGKRDCTLAFREIDVTDFEKTD